MYEIYNEDSFKKLDELEENSIDAIVTDPPYGLTSVTERFGKDGSAPAKFGKDGAFSRLSKGFMGKEWDGTGIERNPEFWAKCLRVLKPGGYLLAFGGTRTYHRIATAIEEAGFDVRDMINWITGQGFPKGIDLGLAVDKKLGKESKVVGVGKSGAAETHTRCMNSQTKSGKDVFGGEFEIKEAQNEWKGWKTQLKPSHEPIVIAQKPFRGTYVDNLSENGVGGINIDECRVGNENISVHNAPKGTFAGGEPDRGSDTNSYREHEGRYPANTILSYDENDKKTIKGFPETKPTKPHDGDGGKLDTREQGWGFRRMPSTLVDNGGSTARYFQNCPLDEKDSDVMSYYYCPKANKKDRDEGLDDFNSEQGHTKGNGLDRVCEFCGVPQLKPELCKCPVKSWVAKPRRNTHATVKPTELMQYLVRLVTPKGGTILDPFMGSGSTGKACMYENAERNANYKFVGIEKETEYFDIAKARIDYVIKKFNLDNK